MSKISSTLLKQMYYEDPNIRQIAKKLNMNYSSLHRRFKRMKLIGKGDIVKVDGTAICKLYSEGYSIHNIADIMNVSSKKIFSVLKSNKVELRKPGVSVSVEDSYFEKLDRADKQYWFGVLSGDGCLINRGDQKVVSLGVSANDGMWVKKFIDSIKSNSSVAYCSNEWTGRAEVSITSEKMFEDLNSHGMTLRKSKSLRVIESSSHFWRGIFDADGSVYIGKSNSKYVNAITSASEHMINHSIDCLNLLNLNYKIYGDDVKTVRLFGDEGLKYMDFLYFESTNEMRLERKYVKYLEYKGEKMELKNGLYKIPYKDAEMFLKFNHYLKSCKPSTAYGWYDESELVAVAAVSSCSGPSVAKSVLPSAPSRVRELHRFCIAKGKNEKNLASKFLSNVLKSYSKDNSKIWAIVSFADSSQGHEGKIYQALSAIKVSEPDTPQLVIVLPDGERLTGRDDIILQQVDERGYNLSECSLERSEGKYKYVMLLGSGKQKKQREKLLSISQSN